MSEYLRTCDVKIHKIVWIKKCYNKFVMIILLKVVSNIIVEREL